MKLNDPFGRVARRDRDRYRTLRSQLHGQGIRDAAAVQRFRHNMSATLLRLLVIIAAVVSIVIVVFPDARNPVLLVGALLLLWFATSYVQTRLYLKKYLRDECSDD